MASDVLIVADDLSGAADCAVSCAIRGLYTEVVLETSAEAVSSADVVAIDANTRHLAPIDAARETERLVRLYGRAPWCFKKIDSTLRGNAAAEISAALRARRAIDRRAIAIVAPAFPATGRTTLGGHQYVGGRPLEETEYWSRERTEPDGHVARMLERAGLATAVIDLAAVRQDPDRLHERMAESAAGRDALVCDAETDDDLRRVAGAAGRFAPATVWAGSAGLATFLPDATGLTGSRPRVAAPAARGPILFVIGSPSTASRVQADVLASENGVVSVSATDVSGVAGALAAGQDVLVRPVSTAAAAALAAAAGRASGLVLTGGETARALLTTLHITSLVLVDEVERGVPRAIATGGRTVPLPVVTKAGAFGDGQTLVRARAALRNTR